MMPGDCRPCSMPIRRLQAFHSTTAQESASFDDSLTRLSARFDRQRRRLPRGTLGETMYCVDTILRGHRSRELRDLQSPRRAIRLAAG